MDSTLSATATQLALFKALNRHLSRAPPLSQCLSKQLLHRRLSSTAYNYGIRTSKPLSSLTSLCAPVSPVRCRFQCVSSSAAPFASGGGNGGTGCGSGGGGGGNGGGGDSQDPKLVVEGAEELKALSTDVIILDVAGMVCGGCAANVKRILENQPQVSSASVNLTTETAIVWPVSEAKADPNWQKQLGEALARHLTSCGFKSSPRGQEDSN
ncbi:hypothetical protein L6164_036325 [Bauhinia variegata]|uniref:Uncharacterized protein n=1 Tax=Bauhinia variegata TaxID=167791 RepID=A0ACB9KGR0_BAUVA|nr:hypothetical protein L6164_036325 [Bauhinia variegata]